ncbi:hypothetical protein HDF15_001482 [Granulicella mallensis]|jgi:hypothetical protein|uniref:Uncharacterized protein n=1 Tax=Granulicella mallensis TaxID=940614 RepID=A0A7W7ZNH7_9BACT|nr:hypothetical protein [Granulicella mallensis]
MDKTIRRVTDLKQQRAENFRYWQSIPLGERLSAISELSVNAYTFANAVKGVRNEDGSRLQRSLVRVERSSR